MRVDLGSPRLGSLLHAFYLALAEFTKHRRHMLLAHEIAETGSYFYFEFVGGAPELVEVVVHDGALRATFVGERGQVELPTLSGCFEGPIRVAPPQHPA
ncbi:MAG: hypothetical protein EOO24_58975 [Comamonadaceae bacterium]|nr:MAG: hypothetical protein EOO24_58975 [Comamonadaceae bacterium]